MDAQPPLLNDFDGLMNGEQSAFIIDLDEANLKPDLSNLRASISISLKSDSLGVCPDANKTNLAFIHAYAYFSCDSSTYSSLLSCSTIPGVTNTANVDSSHYINQFYSNYSVPALLGSVLPTWPSIFHSEHAIPNDDSTRIPIFATSKK